MLSAQHSRSQMSAGFFHSTEVCVVDFEELKQIYSYHEDFPGKLITLYNQAVLLLNIVSYHSIWLLIFLFFHYR